MDQLAQGLAKLGLKPSFNFRQHGILVLTEFCVGVGRHAGNVLDLGVSANDYPNTAPAGVHIHAPLGSVGQNNVSQSPLGADWQYWSRLLTDWATDRSPRHVLAYINRVLLDA